MTQQFITDIVNTQQSGYISAIKVLLKQKGLDDNVFDLLTLLNIYKLSDQNVQNILNHYLDDNDFDISTFES